MTRFIGNSFKITPILIEVNNEKFKDIDFISKIINERIFNLDTIPNAGWIHFQPAKFREMVETEHLIQPINLHNKFRVLPATALVDRIDNNLMKKIPPTIYADLPEEKKYLTIPIDYIFYNNNNSLFCLISATYQKNVDFSIKDFLTNFPFTDYGYAINKNPIQYTIPNDLILWVLYRYYEKNGEIDSNIIVSDVSQLDGRLKVPNSIQYAGKSTPEYLTELKYSIALNRTFTKIEFTLKMNGYIFQFNLDTTGCVQFKPSMCEYCEEDENENNKNLAKAIHIYNVIIPTLKKTYNSDKLWASNFRNDFIKKCAADCKDKL